LSTPFFSFFLGVALFFSRLSRQLKFAPNEGRMGVDPAGRNTDLNFLDNRNCFTLRRSGDTVSFRPGER
jgi:hypothetical protein